MVVAQESDTPQTASGETLDVINPVTQDVIGTIPVTSSQAVAEAVERARFAQQTWGALTVRERVRFFRRWLDVVWQHQDELVQTLRRENGKTDGAAFIELITVDGIVQYYLHHADRILQPERRRTLFPLIQSAKVFHKPHGVVGLITPWNYPFALPFMDMIPALLAGNTVVFKPSEVTPFIGEWGVNLMHEVGIPRDVVQVVQGDGRTGAALVDEVDFVQFTGSTAVGRKIGVRCAERLIPCSLELGGKDPSIVLADADPEMAAIGLLQGAFENAGQMCISIERVYVEEAIYEPLLRSLQRYIRDVTLGAGDSRDIIMGSMTNEAELQRTQAHIQDALDKGARLIHGGKPRPDIGPLFHEPTLLADVDHSMHIMQEETFGPVLPLMKVSSADEAIRLANQSNYGLSASIFSRNLKRAEQLAQRINSGDVSVNRAQFVVGTPSLPSGGQKQSGTGRRNGPEGLLKYTASQSVLLDTLIGAEKSVNLANETVLNIIAVMRKIRRYVPFI